MAIVYSFLCFVYEVDKCFCCQIGSFTIMLFFMDGLHQPLWVRSVLLVVPYWHVRFSVAFLLFNRCALIGSNAPGYSRAIKNKPLFCPIDWRTLIATVSITPVACPLSSHRSFYCTFKYTIHHPRLQDSLIIRIEVVDQDLSLVCIIRLLIIFYEYHRTEYSRRFEFCIRVF